MIQSKNLEELCCITESMAQLLNLIPGQKLFRNCRKKLTNTKEENFDKEKQDIQFENISNLKESLNSSAEMLGCSPVKSVGSREKKSLWEKKTG